MSALLLAGALLLALCGSTLWWSISQARGVGEADGAVDVARARLWASVTPALLMLVVISAGVLALLSPGMGGVERLLAALSARPITAGLLGCAAAGLHPSLLCVRLWTDGRAGAGSRVHLSLHIAATYAAILLLLVAPGGAG